MCLRSKQVTEKLQPGLIWDSRCIPEHHLGLLRSICCPSPFSELSQGEWGLMYGWGGTNRWPGAWALAGLKVSSHHPCGISGRFTFALTPSPSLSSFFHLWPLPKASLPLFMLSINMYLQTHVLPHPGLEDNEEYYQSENKQFIPDHNTTSRTWLRSALSPVEYLLNEFTAETQSREFIEYLQVIIIIFFLQSKRVRLGRGKIDYYRVQHTGRVGSSCRGSNGLPTTGSAPVSALRPGTLWLFAQGTSSTSFR